MLVMTAKLTKKRLITGIIAVGLVICAVILVKGSADGGVLVLDQGTEASKKIELKDIKSADDRINLLKSFGWEVQAEPLEFMEVQIPSEFDEVYEKYNEIQAGQGMDLKKYAGKRVMRYSYQVTNYPSGEQGVIANILIYKNKLIGGDVCSPQLNGFMHGLQRPED